MALYDVDNTVLIGAGQFFLDGSRVWSIKSGAIQFSDDYGVTWTVWHTLTVPSVPYYCLFKDSLGNFYYAGATTFDPGTIPYPYFSSTEAAKIYRVDGVTKAVTVVVTTTRSGVIFYPWGLTEDNDGYLYFGQYGIRSSDGVAVGNVAYVWKSPPGGQSFSRVDIILNQVDRHIHNIQANPYNGYLYITAGDTPKKFFVSTDKLASITQIGGEATGYTGLTFTSEAVYMADDQSAGNNKVWKSVNGGPPEIIWNPPGAYNSQIYSLRAVGDNELWVAVCDEISSPSFVNSIWQLTKITGVTNAWSALKVWEQPGQTYNNGLIGADRTALIPVDNPFIYVWGWEFGENNIRIQRAEIGGATTTTTAAPTTTTAAPTSSGGCLVINFDGNLVTLAASPTGALAIMLDGVVHRFNVPANLKVNPEGL